ncbi:hypothetical protein CASFOL_033692 [Castilleja foliolosa]|uniref:Uncharacterized protein n=1 Tax=Castilleja foliolosa TaxID=1961234 RepID=A0ABD3BXQ2_9LAMI
MSFWRKNYVRRSRLSRVQEKCHSALDCALDYRVARLLMDTSVIQFYPTLFVLTTDIMDMLGDLVWDRIKKKAEITEEGRPICPLPDNFKAGDICFEAKETCNNWFNKIGSVLELLPRM